ncbi:3-oxoacyl-[acyl-carrier-protein] reductase [Butyrivibrio sp. NC3005]|uniref:3-oxoacyl-[acyl-carrier-protein] reductase n=1 Tax=Butyrivibrio sp. NC3005 TaxID=1280685 RepID=UPI0003F8B157|nr:3-oxoacyl-[acyl-carrier-protein] reductase [Butyrivibrio sp. NC3005]
MEENNEKVLRTAVITGASRGIGRAIAIKLAKSGINVVIGYAGNSEKALETSNLCIEEARKNGFEIETLTCQADISTQEGASELINASLDKFGRIDILVNNAGRTMDNLLLRMDEEHFDKVIDTNLKGAFLCCQLVARTMMKQRFGRIINISSVVGLHGNAGQANYAASKAGLIGLTKSIAKELGAKGITCNAVAPGFINTDMTKVMTEDAKKGLMSTIPMKRAGEGSDIANAVAFLASEESSYITGQVLGVDGGMGC